VTYRRYAILDVPFFFFSENHTEFFSLKSKIENSEITHNIFLFIYLFRDLEI